MDWIDLDMVRGHPSILYSVAKNNNLNLIAFEKYLANKDKIIAELLEYYQSEQPEDPDEFNSWKPLTDKDIKDIFNISIYGGGHSTWVSQMAKKGKEVSTNEIHMFERQFVTDCRMVMDYIYNSNPDIIEKVKGEETNEYKLKCKVMAYFCGTIENEILHIAYKFLCERGIIKNDQLLLEYDGLCFPNPHIDNLDEIINELNYIIRDKTKINVRMIKKEYETEYVHQDIIEQRKIMSLPLATQVSEASPVLTCEGIVENQSCNKSFYQNWRDEFNLTHFKVINKSFFVKCIKNEDGFIEEFKIFSKSDIITSYEHITYMDYDCLMPVKRACIKEWIQDDEMSKYEDMKIVPPPLICPKNVFNIWTPFYVEYLYLNQNYTWNLDKSLTDLMKNRDIIINHLKIVCNHNEMDFTYLVRWIGQMLKFPAIKTTCITLIGEEGSGKGTIIHLLRKLMGDKKVFETSSPEEYVWGKFNGVMADAFFVNCNELEFKAQQEAESKIKTLITDVKGLRINEKGIKSFALDSFHRFMFSTNKQVPLKTHSKDRRHKIIRSSDEKCDDKIYFQTIYDILQDERVLLLMYEYFCNLPNLDTFHTEKIIQNEYQKILSESFTKSVPQLFMEQFTRDNYDECWVEKSGEELYQTFNSFKSKNGFTFECDIAKLMRNIQLLNFPEGCLIKRHTKKGNLNNFNIGLLKQHFKLEDLED
jgi:energy-coupling factor transporter ATP-binding protein EcfA2